MVRLVLMNLMALTGRTHQMPHSHLMDLTVR